MAVPIPTSLTLQFQARDIECCRDCCSGNTAKDRTVTVTDEHNQETALPATTQLVLEQGHHGTRLRPKKRFESTSDATNHQTVGAYYGGLCQKYSPEVAAIITAWKGVDFIHLYRNAHPLSLSHVESIANALREIDPIQQIFAWGIERIKQSTHMDIALPDEATRQRHLFIDAIDKKGLVAISEMRQLANALKPLRKSDGSTRPLYEIATGGVLLHVGADYAERFIYTIANIAKVFQIYAQRNNTHQLWNNTIPIPQEHELPALIQILETMETVAEIPRIESARPHGSGADGSGSGGYGAIATIV